jgi:hypothetical protein
VFPSFQISFVMFKSLCVDLSLTTIKLWIWIFAIIIWTKKTIRLHDLDVNKIKWTYDAPYQNYMQIDVK